ncbi:uncharacterized protein BDR25DRAFT_378891 [Lindgomyces ingoldianus]|uniref:Uncharacterized protein n=1 Tax=Lindgomyces ingoldianus TaxID=673940 RepID=A0ACB6QEG7_9PLEO|nr:uncharacterized protein BDR25DRAFT_378891 [Lindgomyces ingoldianus]KAF2465255.1 hypothetical protein BDR25DRAFT_378891 [Lindgomyces ingoldianus]
MSAHVIPLLHEAASKTVKTHLSGATMAELTVEQQIHLMAASPHSPEKPSLSEMTSNRCSVASTTKSTLRHSNQLLIEMLQNIQAELSAHRSILLDVQHRVSHLEHESVASINNDPPQLAALQALEGRGSKRNSKLVPPEGQVWWQACQNFARNSDPPLSATEFLRTPRRLSGIDWQSSRPSAKPRTPPATPPEVEDLPPLTPTSEDSNHNDVDQSDVDTPHVEHDIRIEVDEIITSTPWQSGDIETEDDIKESTVEIDKKKLPVPPTLLPPPGGKQITVNNEAVITVEETVSHVDNLHRYYKGRRSLVTYRALMKNQKTEKGWRILYLLSSIITHIFPEHLVLIHFHKATYLKDAK